MANEEVRERNIQQVLQTAASLFISHGIELTTMEMLSRESGISRASINRYFTNKMDCVLRTAGWISQHIKEQRSFREETLLESGGTGLGALRTYMLSGKEVYLREPRTFVLLAEFKLYAYYFGMKYEKQVEAIVRVLEYTKLVERILTAGQDDGSITRKITVSSESDYFCESYFSFLSDLALKTLGQSGRTYDAIDAYIERALAMYSG